MTYDLTDPDFLTDPTPMLAGMRAEGALVETKMPFLGKVYMTTTDAAARRVLKDQETFARNPVRAGGKSYDRIMWWLPGFMKPIMQNMLLHDGPEHKGCKHLTVDLPGPGDVAKERCVVARGEHADDDQQHNRQAGQRDQRDAAAG